MHRLVEPGPFGYSAAGIVPEGGHGVQDVKPGDRVAVAAPARPRLAVAGRSKGSPRTWAIQLQWRFRRGVPASITCFHINKVIWAARA